ncbi:MAG TPA: c-type cytochrome [Gemmatimonadaceae bacterium]|nr:c-type cytochrome [Gemmatimonadaceae bacterium]
MKRAAIVVAACVLIAAPLAAQQKPAQSAPANSAQSSSLYTAEQATRGEKVYANVCVECHEKLEYTGPEFRAKWNNRPAFELFDLLRSTMPDENPGTLPTQDYADVLAYMMKLNGVPAGKTPMPIEAEALKKLKIVIPK